MRTLVMGLVCLLVGCGSRRSIFYDDAGNGGDPFFDIDGSIGAGDGGSGACVNLECQIVPCGGGGHTTISGTVYDPAGKNPLYNVYVYVPNAPLSPIPTGPVCKACQAPASGSPIVGAQTDARGHFTLKDVPAGKNIPLVMQAGKFRRAITIPSVEQCTDNPIGAKDNTGAETLTRLPRKQAEQDPSDNLPQMAVSTGGCDALECLLRKIGFDDSEFTNPNGRIRIFKGLGINQAIAKYSTSTLDTLWTKSAELDKYDIVVNSCECYPYDRQTAYSTMHDYVNGGGRLFGTHYHYNWFSPPKGPVDFQSMADWKTQTIPRTSMWIDTSFPKGQALDQWIQNVFQNDPMKPSPGRIVIPKCSADVGHVQNKTSRWIYYGDQNGPGYGTAYLSFNTPVNAQPTEQCGRAVFSDLHVSDGPVIQGLTTFPNECNDDPMTQQEAALEFLFFDLSSCINDENNPPPPPPPN